MGLLQHDGSNARRTNQTDVIVFCTSLLRKGESEWENSSCEREDSRHERGKSALMVASFN